MLDHREPKAAAPASGSPSYEDRAEIVRKAIQRARAERAKMIRTLARRLVGAITFKRRPRGEAASHRDHTATGVARHT
jgi:hypothetical protein